MLYLVATPIGDTSEITLRALKILTDCENIICESTKEASKLLKAHQISGKKYHVLDEHSTADDLNGLLQLVTKHDVALVTDCGTPSFADPGARLVHLCRKNKIPVKSVLGPSSLMGLLSLTSQRFDQFYFRGFLSSETEKRKQDWLALKKETKAIVIMDTPYRFQKTLHELIQHFPRRQCLLALDLSQETECVLEGTPQEVADQVPFDKAEFMVLIYP